MLLMAVFPVISIAQITFNGCHPLFDDQDFILTQISTDANGRHVFETIPIDGDEPCSGIGICEFRMSYNDAESRWEFIADDGTGDFSSPFLIYSNTEDSTPNPPSLMLGVWLENGTITEDNCGGNLTPSNATLMGDVQDTLLSTEDLELQNLISVYPNPVKNKIYIKYGGYDLDHVSFHDVFGKLVLNTSDFDTIDVSKLNSGLYFMQIQGDNVKITKKIIVE
jgi:hypothetical protein